jgi:hypothetical protein
MSLAPCLSDSELVCLVDGSLPAEATARMDAHLDSCPRCFAVVASLLRGHSGPTPLDEPSPTEPTEQAYFDKPRLFARRYVLQSLIGQGGMGQVYRAFDRLTGQAVALKRVFRRGTGSMPNVPKARSEVPPDAYASCLEREFRILATLRHPHIISVLDYGYEESRRPFYSMELLVGARPLLPMALALPLSSRLHLLIQLLHALGYLHRRGVLHRDLKPSNLLVVTDGEGQQVLKVLDFGLSSGPEGMPLTALGGTLGYIAPELLRGAPPSEAADLYSVGMVAYELLVGSHPFYSAGRSSRLLFGVLREAPDLTSLPRALADVLGRTLSKRPEDRPADAATLLRELCAAAGIAQPSEPPAVRDSFLVAARFVGREAELAALTQTLTQARAGRGSLWLLGGESGAGKSRLMDELRSIALPEGVLVLRGQAIQSGGTAYQLWRDVLRLLALHIELTPYEVGLLSAIVPDLAALLEQPMAWAPLAEPHGAGARLLRTLHEVLQRVAAPTLVLLEDLQWADEESLTLLAQVSERLADQPLLIVASYREEEARPLPSHFPAA